MPVPDQPHVEIAIAGAGLSGLGMAIALRRDGYDSFVVLEREADLGGTWRDNTYPGCACDIPSVLYSYSDAQNPDWSQAFALAPEIWAYMKDVAGRHDVASHMRYGQEVRRAEFNEARGLWEIETSRGEFTAEILISATGALADPSIPALPGSRVLPGPRFTRRAGITGTRSRGARSRSWAPARRRSSSCPRSSPE